MVAVERGDPATARAGRRASALDPSAFPLRLQLPPERALTDERFIELRRLNEGWRLETDAEGGLLIMAPTGPDSSDRSGRIYAQILFWSDARNTGRAFESSATFMLPSGDRRSPDAAWISDARLAAIADDDAVIWRICPDFVVEVRSASDALADQQSKLELWISQGARLGWLVDPLEETVWIYRSGQNPEKMERPATLTASEIADDLTVGFTRVWRRRGSATS